MNSVPAILLAFEVVLTGLGIYWLFRPGIYNAWSAYRLGQKINAKMKELGMTEASVYIGTKRDKKEEGE